MVSNEDTLSPDRRFGAEFKPFQDRLPRLRPTPEECSIDANLGETPFAERDHHGLLANGFKMHHMVSAWNREAALKKSDKAAARKVVLDETSWCESDAVSGDRRFHRQNGGIYSEHIAEVERGARRQPLRPADVASAEKLIVLQN